MVWFEAEKVSSSSVGTLGYCWSDPRHRTGALGSDGEQVTDGGVSDRI